MPKDKLTEYSATNASNTDVGGVNIDEGMLPSAVNNSIRELMTHLKNFSDGTDAIDALDVTGDLTVDTNTLHVDATNNRVGVGTASPSHPLHVAQSRASDVVGLIENTNTTSGFGLKIKAGGTDADRYSLRVDSQAGTELFRVRTAGGVTFNGDTAAANALDDYEEGTWTPAFATSGTGFSSIGYHVQKARYVKVGRQVHTWFLIATNALTKGSASSSIVITGLPYTVENVDYQSGVIAYAQDWTTNHPISCLGTPNQTQLFLYHTNGSTSHVNTGVANMVDHSGSNKHYVYGALSYRAA